VRALLKAFQRASATVADFQERCALYESFQFQNIQELEYFYLHTKKHYLAKAFAHEFATKLENNKFTSSMCGGSMGWP
jgi:hypothetical protein